VALGAGAGLLMGTAAGILLSARMNIPGPDMLLIAAVATLFALVGFASCYMPAHRATTMRAMEALRAE
jgi:ABC-type antimicrobial peptide transport system permease subunit